MTNTNKISAHRVTYEVRKDPTSPKRWCIFNTYLNRVEDGGFFSRTRAEDYLDREYNLSTV
jgi:hypothetical protein